MMDEQAIGAKIAGCEVLLAKHDADPSDHDIGRKCGWALKELAQIIREGGVHSLVSERISTAMRGF
jgi:hypothetical protein